MLQEKSAQRVLPPLKMKTITNNLDAATLLKTREQLLEELVQIPTHRCTCLSTKYAHVYTESILQERLELLKHKMSDATLQKVLEMVLMSKLFLWTMF